ncbi:MAG: DUF4012 domain-containing protein [Candidatus Pacebacteria bacterium]|nr:DUF4012 domain-containing protein [Candidatus Paceibacterota bacterium]
MNQFSTQFLDEELQLLLIRDQSELSILIRDFLYQEQELSVLEVEPDQLIRNQALLESLAGKQFYKIIYLTGFEGEASCSKHSQSLVKSFLKQRSEQKVVVLRLPTLIKQPAKCFLQWLDYQQEQTQFLSDLNRELTKKKFLLGQDVGLSERLSGKTILPPLGSILANTQPLSQLIDPQVKLHLQTQADFFQSIKKELLSPQEKSLLVRGKSADSSEVCQEIKRLYQVYYQQPLKTIKVALETKKLETMFELVSLTNQADYRSVVDQAVRQLPQLKLKMIDFSEVKESRRKSVKLEEKEDEPLKVACPPSKQKKEKSTEQKPIRSEREEKKEKEKEAEGSKQESFQEVEKIFSDKRKKQKVKRRVSKAKKIKKITHKTKRKKTVFWGGVGLIGMGVLVGLTVLGYIASFSRVKSNLVSDLSKLKAGREISSGSFLTTSLNWTNQLVEKVASWPVLERVDLTTSQHLALLEAGEKLQKRDQLTAEIYLFLWGESNQDLEKVITKLTRVDQELYQELSVIQPQLEKVAETEYELNLEVDGLLDWLKSQRKRLAKSQQLNPLLPNLLALDGPRTYALVLQDSLELRSTGGFVQTVALVTLNQGVIVDYQVFSVSQLDQKLSGQIEAPSEIKTLLGEDQLLLRDANWSPDFPAAAKKIAWFIRETTNQQVDGVIALNYQIVKQFLGQFGPIQFKERGGEITNKNLEERLVYYAGEEVDQPGSQQFQTELLRELIGLSSTLNPEQAKEFSQLVYRSLEEKQILVSFERDSEKNAVAGVGWAGQLVSPDCPSQFMQEGCLVEPLYQVDSNVGMNKVGHLVSRQIDHQIEVSQERISHRRTIVYQNSSHSQVWPLGIYKNYLRLYLHPQVKLNSIKINGQPINQDLLVNYVDLGRKVYGFLVEVPPQDSKKVELDYQLNTPLQNEFAYLFFEQKQPGLREHNADYLINYSSTLVPKLVVPKALVEDQQIQFYQDGSDHFFLGVEFEKI